MGSVPPASLTPVASLGSSESVLIPEEIVLDSLRVLRWKSKEAVRLRARKRPPQNMMLRAPLMLASGPQSCGV